MTDTPDPRIETTRTQVMSEHAPEVQTTIMADCAFEECDHDDDCPEALTVVCASCTSAESIENGGEGWVTEWPCLFATRHGDRDDAVKERLLAEARA